VAFGSTWLPLRRTANFALELAGWRVLGLDSARWPFVHGRLGREQLDWLAAELDAARGPALVFVHHPPVRVGSWWLDKDRLRDRRRLAALVGSSRVRVIATGHVHQEFAGSFAGAQVWTSPSTAYQFRPRSLWPARIHPGSGYRVLELDGESLTTEVVRLGAAQG